MTTYISPRDWEALSAYLDGQLAPKERQLLEYRMQSRADLRAALEELRRTREVLGVRLPVRAPRNFTLTPEMAGLRPRSRPTVVLFPAMRLTSVFAGLMFIIVVLGDLLVGGRLASQPMMAIEPEREAVLEAAPEEFAMKASEAPALAVEAPAAEAVQGTPPPLAKVVEAPTPTLGLALAQPIIVETEAVEGYPQEPGVGGGADDTQLDQEALSQMAPAPTATPLPTPTLTPTLTPPPSPSPVVIVQPTAPAPYRTRLERYLAWTYLRWVEIALAVVSVGAGLLALVLHRAGRS